MKEVTSNNSQLFGIASETWDTFEKECFTALVAAPRDQSPAETEKHIQAIAERHRMGGIEFPEMIPVVARFVNGAMSIILWNNGPHHKVQTGDCCRYFGSCYVHDDGALEPGDLYACQNSRIVFIALRGEIAGVHVHIDDMMAAIGKMNDPSDFRIEYKDMLACALLASRAFGN